MDKLVEKIARAINPVAWDERFSNAERGSALRKAQAVLAAIDEAHAIVPKEPTEAMLLAGRATWAGEAYRAMIEAASPQVGGNGRSDLFGIPDALDDRVTCGGGVGTNGDMKCS